MAKGKPICLCSVGLAALALLFSGAPARADLPLFGQTKVDERQTGIRALATDGEGFLWVLGDGGLCRFDGHTWACPYPACEGNFLGGGSGNVWALCDAGHLLQAKGHHMSQFVLPTEFVGETAKLVGVADEEAFIAHASGTYAWRPGQAPRKVSAEPAVCAARWGHITWLTSARGLLRIDPSEKAKIVLDRPTNLLALSGQGEAFVRAGVGDAAELLMFTADGAPTSVRFEADARSVSALLVDDGEDLLWSAEEGGVVGYSLQGGPARFARDMRDGLPYPIVATLLRDAQGVWLGTAQGLAQLRINPPLFNVGRAQGMEGDSVFSVTATPDGAVWMTQGYGLSRYKNGVLHNAAARDGLVHIDLRTVAITPDGEVWSAGLVNKLVRLNLKTNRFQPVTLPQQPDNVSVHPLRVGPTGILWIGLGDGGVGKLHNGQFVLVFAGEAGKQNRVFDLFEDSSGAVWFTREDGTVVAVKDDQSSSFRLEASAMGVSLYPDALGHVWVGTSGGGLFRIKQGRVARMTTQNGLWDNRIHAVIEDGHGWLWMSSVRGVFRVLRSQADAVMDGWASSVEAIAYQREDGLRNNEASQGLSPGCARDARGRLWFAMVGGAAVFDPQALVQSPPPRSIHVKAAQVDGLGVKSSGTAVPAGHGALTFTYGAPALWDASRTRYRARLVGWDDAWLDQGQNTHVAYLGVPPGRYMFEVQAHTWDRPELNVHAAWALQLLPPFYRRGWFVAVLSLVTLAIAALALRARRVRQARLQAALFADRTRIAQDIHDSLEQDLCGMKMHMDAANLWLDKDLVRAREHLGRAADLVSDGMVDMRTAVWGLRAGWVRGPELALGLEQRLERIAHAAQLKLQFFVQGTPLTLPSLVATQIFYIAREAMTNAVKHAHATVIHVRIDFRVSGWVTLVVEDDGVGMSTESQAGPRDGGLSGGLGLEGMRARAAMVGGTLRVTSSAAGTSVTVDVDVRGAASDRVM